jgi:hypothetical protein
MVSLFNSSLILESNIKFADFINLLYIAIPATITAFAAYYSAKKSAENIFRYNNKLEINKMKYQVYSQLVGQKYLVSQLYILYFLSLIQSLYTSKWIKYLDNVKKANSHNRLKRSGDPPSREDIEQSRFMESVEETRKQILKENQRASNKSADLLIELAKSNELFWRTIGQMNIVFEDNNIKNSVIELERFEKSIEKFEATLEQECNTEVRVDYKMLKDLDFSVISDWPKEKQVQLKIHIKEFNNLIDDLLDKLRVLL